MNFKQEAKKKKKIGIYTKKFERMLKEHDITKYNDLHCVDTEQTQSMTHCLFLLPVFIVGQYLPSKP